MDSFGKAYLIMYNAVQTFGWATLLAQVILHLVEHNSYSGLYEHCSGLLNIFQTLAILEVFHALFGLVRASAFLTLMQVFSRVFLTWGILALVPESRDSLGMLLFVMAWSITEVIRYSYYAFQLVGTVPTALLWCRYSFFIVLYPLGVLGELMAVWIAKTPVCSKRLYSISLPNKANMSFSYCAFLYLFMAAYLPGFPQLYGHMLKQRKKFLGSSEKKD